MVRRVLFLALMVLQACNSDIAPEKTSSDFYYPIAEGNTWVYAQEETNYAVGLPPETNLTYYKETIGKEIDPNVYLLQRSRSNNNLWEALPTKFISRTPAELRIFDAETNTALLKFPLYEGSTWKENERDFTLLSNTPYFSRPSEGFTLEMINDSSAIDLVREFIFFTKQDGPIFISKEELAYCQETTDCIGKGIISSGRKVTRTLINRTGDLPFD